MGILDDAVRGVAPTLYPVTAEDGLTLRCFTRCAWASFMNRAAQGTPARAKSVGPAGRSATTIARLAARATARVNGINSSTVTGRRVSFPKTLFEALSPPRGSSTPASSNTCAV